MYDEDLLDEEFPVLVLVDDEGIEHQFELLAELEIEENLYRVLISLDDDDDEDEEEFEVVILKVVFDEDGTEFLTDIEDEEEWELVADAWREMVDSEEI